MAYDDSDRWPGRPGPGGLGFLADVLVLDRGAAAGTVARLRRTVAMTAAGDPGWELWTAPTAWQFFPSAWLDHAGPVPGRVDLVPSSGRRVRLLVLSEADVARRVPLGAVARRPGPRGPVTALLLRAAARTLARLPMPDAPGRTLWRSWLAAQDRQDAVRRLLDMTQDVPPGR